ncbi:hypothetical protein BH23CHL1_BH23CHL1_15480 [soil metagenome]
MSNVAQPAQTDRSGSPDAFCMSISATAQSRSNIQAKTSTGRIWAVVPLACAMSTVMFRLVLTHLVLKTFLLPP